MTQERLILTALVFGVLFAIFSIAWIVQGDNLYPKHNARIAKVGTWVTGIISTVLFLSAIWVAA